MLSNLRHRSPVRRRRARPFCYRPALEVLEDRITPYVLSGYKWANVNVSVSYMPDGTLISSSYPSNLLAVYNAAYPQATWQREVARALQVWANVSNLNFHFVADDGSPQGTAGLAQGDSRFGDIRIGGYNMGSGILGIGWNPGSTTTAGDVELNTASALAIGSMADLASVVMHEAGHGIGFNHTLVDPAVMEGGLWGVYPAPYADDVAGVQAMYGARTPDAYDAGAGNNTLATATALTLSYGGVAFNADITTMADLDYYKVTAPAGTDGTLTVAVDARNLSLFDPKVAVFESSGTQLATASASTYGDVATVHLAGLVAGQTYYLLAGGATTDVFGMGAYRLSAQFGGITPPPPPGPDRFEVNNTAATATNFGTVSSVSQTALTFHTAGDVDYYTAAAANKGTYTVSVTPTQGSGTLSLVVLNAQQAVLASGQSQTGGVTLSVILVSGQQYYVKASSPTGNLFIYTLSIVKSGGGGGGGGHHLVVPGVENPDDQAAGDVFYQNAADDPDYAGPVAHNPVSSSPLTPTSDAPVATGTRLSGPLPAAAGTLQNPAVSRAALAGALLDLGHQPARILPAKVTAPEAVPAAPDRGSSGVVVQDVRRPRAESGGGAVLADEEPDEVPAAPQVPQAEPAGPRGGPATEDEGNTPVRQRAGDACFADGSWRADPVSPVVPLGETVLKPASWAEPASPAPHAATAVVALAVVLGSGGGVVRVETEPRRQRRFRI
jgi:Matrixin